MTHQSIHTMIFGLMLASACNGGSVDVDGSLRSDSLIRTDSTTTDATTTSDSSLSTKDARVNDLPPGQRRVFVTSEKLKGNLGGTSGADTKCMQAAAAAGLHGTTWIAWLSTATQDAIDRLKDVGPWHTMDGKQFFADKAAIADPFTDPENGLWLDENGSWLASDRIWTGTGPDGRYVSSIGDTCQAWTSDSMSDQARIGQVGRSDQSWTSFSFTTCDQSGHLICFEQ